MEIIFDDLNHKAQQRLLKEAAIKQLQQAIEQQEIPEEQEETTEPNEVMEEF